MTKVEDDVDGTEAASGALQPKVESALQVPKVVMADQFFAKDTPLNVLEDPHELKTSFALH